MFYRDFDVLSASQPPLFFSEKPDVVVCSPKLEMFTSISIHTKEVGIVNSLALKQKW